MAEKRWEPIKVNFCEHKNCQVSLEVQAVYPAEFLPDQGPRITGHRCSMGLQCNMESPSCVWAGTNPSFDPFLE